MIAIALNGGTKDQIKDFTQFINNHLAITAAEAHIEINKGQGEWQLQSSKYTDAYILLAMMATSSDYPLLPKMARYLLNNSKKGYWDSTHTTAAVLNALFKYIKVNEKEVPDFTATVMLGKNQLLSHDFKGRTSEKAEKNLPITDLMNLTGPTELVFNKLGDGRLYYRTRLTYASTITPLPPLEEGFTIFKKLAHYDKSKNGEPFRRGDIVRVQLDFVLPASRNYIVINDGLPAGLEAINFSLKTAKQHLKVDDAKGIRIDHIEIYGNKVLVFSDYLPAGSYQFEYLASASTKGTFTIPPAQIEEMYHPETFGRTMTSTIEIE